MRVRIDVEAGTSVERRWSCSDSKCICFHRCAERVKNEQAVLRACLRVYCMQCYALHGQVCVGGALLDGFHTHGVDSQKDKDDGLNAVWIDDVPAVNKI